MNKLVSTIVLATTLALPAATAFAGSKANDSSSNVDSKMKTGSHAHSPGTVGAMDNNPEGSSFTASKAVQKKDLLKSH